MQECSVASGIRALEADPVNPVVCELEFFQHIQWNLGKSGGGHIIALFHYLGHTRVFFFLIIIIIVFYQGSVAVTWGVE